MHHSSHHSVLYRLPIGPDESIPPTPLRGPDKWDSYHVRLPCSVKNQYPIENVRILWYFSKLNHCDFTNELPAGRHRTHQEPLVPDLRHARPRSVHQPGPGSGHSHLQHEIQSHLEVPRPPCAVRRNGRRRPPVLLRRHAARDRAAGPAAARGAGVLGAVAQVRQIGGRFVQPTADRFAAGERISVHLPAAEHAEAELGVSIVSGHQFQSAVPVDRSIGVGEAQVCAALLSAGFDEE